MRLLLFCLALAYGSIASHASQRSSSQRAKFIKDNPCPAVTSEKNRCPGYIVDHIVPLCAGGSDSPANMQWQTIEEAKAKDKQEWQHCRTLKRLPLE